MPGPNLADEIHDSLLGPITANNTLEVATRNGLINLKGNRPLTSRQEFDEQNVWRQVNGATVQRTNDLYALSTDGTQTGSIATLETSQLGVYRSGVLNEMSAGVYLDSLPTDDGEVRVGWGINTVDDGIYHVFDADGWRVTFESLNHRDVDVRRSEGEWKRGEVTEKYDANGDLLGRVYGLDPLRGNNESAISWHPAEGYVYGLSIGWYGPSSTLAWVLAPEFRSETWAQRRIPLFLYRPAHEPAFSIPNRPIHVSADNGSTAEEVAVRVGGRQFAYQGDVEPNEKEVFQEGNQQDLPMDGTGAGPKDWYPVAVIRRSTDYPGSAVGLSEFKVSSPDHSLSLHARTIDSQYVTGTSYAKPADYEATSTALEFDLASDTPDRVSVETFTDTDDVVKPQGVAISGDHVGTGQKNTAAAGTLSGALGFPVVRDQPTVLFARSRDETTAQIDTAAKMVEIQ